MFHLVQIERGKVRYVLNQSRPAFCCQSCWRGKESEEEEGGEELRRRNLGRKMLADLSLGRLSTQLLQFPAPNFHLSSPLLSSPLLPRILLLPFQLPLASPRARPPGRLSDSDKVCASDGRASRIQKRTNERGEFFLRGRHIRDSNMSYQH